MKSIWQQFRHFCYRHGNALLGVTALYGLALAGVPGLAQSAGGIMPMILLLCACLIAGVISKSGEREQGPTDIPNPPRFRP